MRIVQVLACALSLVHRVQRFAQDVPFPKRATST